MKNNMHFGWTPPAQAAQVKKDSLNLYNIRFHV